MNIKTATTEQLIIHWADVLILSSNYKGEIDIMSFYPFDGILENPTNENVTRWKNDEARKIRNTVIGRLGDVKGQLDIITKELTKYLEGVKSHLLIEGYIDEPNPIKTGWTLNDTGKLVKRLGGHKKYKAYKKRELSALRSDQNAKIFWWVREIMKWGIVAALGYLLRYITEPKLTQSKDPQASQTTQKTASTKLNAKDTLKH